MEKKKILNLSKPISVAFIGTYPPRQCGIATFTCDISDAIGRQNWKADSYIIAVNDASNSYQYNKNVAFQIRQQDLSSYIAAARFINESKADVVNIQHEYGIFGGRNGEYLITLLEHLKKPAVVAFHTTLPEPDDYMRRIARIIGHYASAVVGLTYKSAEILEKVYGINRRKLRVVLHGVPNVNKVPTHHFKKFFNLQGRTVMSTFGLINPDKGIEYMINALPEVVAKYPEVVYLVLGQTHPVIKREVGEVYRESLIDTVKELGIENNVIFHNEYMEFNDLVRYLLATDIYVTPNLSKNQIVSGTLAYALGCGKAVISTPYLYAQEAMAHGRGLFVDYSDSQGLTDSIMLLLDHPEMKKAIEDAAYRYGRLMIWRNVASEYMNILSDVLRQHLAYQANEQMQEYFEKEGRRRAIETVPTGS
jgi:glycosyltransferase involved in cell wall biosynthesis